jgi:type IV pilus biogenesis protein CpaD/CtpE
MRTGCLPSRGLVLGVLAVSLIALAGCAGDNYLDPYQKPYAWHPTHASDANVAAQVVDPHDLVVGRGTIGEDSQASTMAIQHIWADTPKPFISDGGGGGGSSGGGSAGGPGASGSGPGASGGSAGGSGGSSGGSN